MKKEKGYFLDKKSIIENSILIVFLVTIFFVARIFIENTNQIVKAVEKVGFFGPIFLIVIMILGILFTPIPGFAWVMTAGYIYGALLGSVYSYISFIIGAMGIFMLSKKINKHNPLGGKRFQKKRDKYSNLIKQNKNILYAIYAIPILPVSIVSAIAATSSIKIKEFLKIILLSFLPLVLFFSFFGSGISRKNIIEIGIFTLVTISLFIIFYEKLRKMNTKKQK